MIAASLYYLRNHPIFVGRDDVNFSHFPSDDRIAPYIKKFARTEKTPAYLLDMCIMEQRLDSVKRSLSRYWKKVAIAYSFKTNYAPASALRRVGTYADVGSERELHLALRYGYAGEKIVFNGPNKTKSSLVTAMRHNVLVQVDNRAELMRLEEFSRTVKLRVRIGCRLNLSGHSMGHSHFGFSRADLISLPVLVTLKKRYIRFEGVHVHTGTDIDQLDVFGNAARAAAETLTQMEKAGLHARYVNCGGGMKSHGRKPYERQSWNAYTTDEYAQTIWEAMRTQYPDAGKLRLMIEPGRYLVDDAAVFVTRVQRVHKGMKQTVFADGATTMLSLIPYRPQILRIFSPSFQQRNGNIQPTIIYGATLREDDVLFRGWLPSVSEGDVIVYYCIGAYNASLTPEFIFDKPKTHVIF